MKKILLILSPKYVDEPQGSGDKAYARRLESLLAANKSKASVFWGKIETKGELDIISQRHGFDAIATTREDVLKVYEGPKVKIADYYGSMLTTPGGLELLILPPMKWLVRVSYGEWFINRMLSKILAPETWPQTSEFKYKVLEDTRDYHEFLALVPKAWLISIDIETLKPNIIRSISYTLKFHDGSTMTGCFRMDSMEKVQWMRELNDTAPAKVTQNGKYECAYFAAWNAPMRNWSGDTLNAMHATWSELPKKLNFVSAIFNRKHIFWKDLGNEGGWSNLLEYNALDTWQTCEAFCAWLQEAPKYARDNYAHKMVQNFIAHEMEMLGLKRDTRRKLRWAKLQEAKIARKQKSLETMVGVPGFNSNSYKQVRALLKALTGKDHTASDDKALKKIMLQHPLNERVLGEILDLRSEIKILGTYLGYGDKDKDYHGRWLYSINPHGTDTGRDSSQEHHFWCGQNVQNVPNGRWEIKNTVEADPGFILFEADYSQAEARGVAYSSGDKHLIEAVESVHDFHSWNASQFFGVPYDKIYQDAVPEYIDAETGQLVEAQHGKVLDKPLRNLAKRVNHGTNYNMGAQVLLDTMGEKEVRTAQKLLQLPKSWSLLQVTGHLLETYDVIYPRVKGAYYNYIKRQVRLTKMLVGATGWTRYCFGDPSSNKLDLNSYVAHVTQSLNAMILDEAARRVFIWRYEEGLTSVLKVHAKIHDSLLFSVAETHLHLAERIPKIMMFPVDVTDCTGVIRSMLVPADLKRCGKRWEMFQR